MKKRIMVLTTIMMILMVNFSYAVGNVVFYKGDKQIESEYKTFIQNGEMMLPVRFLENFNTEVVWKGKNEGIDIVKNYTVGFVDDGVEIPIFDREQNKIIYSKWQKSKDDKGEYWQRIIKFFDLESKKTKVIVSETYEGKGEVIEGAFNWLYRREGEKDATIYLNKKEYIYKGEKQYLKNPPVLKDGTTYIPISFIKNLYPNFKIEEINLKGKKIILINTNDEQKKEIITECRKKH